MARADREHYAELAGQLPEQARPYLIPEIIDGGKSKPLRHIRDDVLGYLRVHRQIDEAQYHAGLKWQGHYEIVEASARAIDFRRDAVDGGKFMDPFDDRRLDATEKLKRADFAVQRTLGNRGVVLLRDVLGMGLNLAEAAQKRGLVGKRGVNYVSRQFQDILEVLVEFYGLATKRA